MSLLIFDGVDYRNGEKSILKNITLEIHKGDFISVVGPSGGGKTTLLKLCCNLTNPTKGGIYFNNKSIHEYAATEYRQRVAYCFQTPYLFGDTVLDNLNFPYTIRGKKIDMNRIHALFSDFQIDINMLHQSTTNLSGGEKQRIALIRSILFVPEVLLLDEVTSALDKDNTLIVEKVIDDLNLQGTTIMWITHNELQSKKYANKILRLENGEIHNFQLNTKEALL
ncbi:MAG: ATP-binding cassette domain-containing protein [Bacillota bacterium]|nr:ATP-binding cassette domain-containing protein [Bacillota bacterium]